MDNYTEQIVSRASNGGDRAKRAAIVFFGFLAAAAVIVLSYLLVPMMLILAMGIAVGIVYGVYYIYTGTFIEYEYIVTNGEIDIDKIIGKRKRERLLTIKASAFERFGMVKDNPDCGNGMTRVLAVDGLEEDDYYAEFQHDRYGETCLIFSPNEKVLSFIEPYIPKSAKK